MPGSLLLWHVSKTSLGFWVIRTPTFGTTMPKKSKSNSTYLEMGSFPLSAAVSWNSWCAFAFSPLDGLIWGRISCLKNLCHINVTWLPESSSDGIFFLQHPMFIWGMLPWPSVSPRSYLEQRPAGWIFFNQTHYCFTITCIVIPVWTTDLLSIRLVQGLRSHYFFGTWVVPGFVVVAFPDVVTCSWANSHAILLFTQTQLSLTCLVSLQ